MKKITFLLMLLTVTVGFAQTLPLDFEDPLDDNWGAFNGATAGVVTDPTDATNQVLEITSNGNDFDGAALNMGSFVDLSNDSDNTITFEFWSPDATTRTHLFKLEGGTPPAPATELYFDTNVDGWQTVTLDFGPGLAADYTIIVIFADSGVGNTATGTYYIDDIDGPSGGSIGPDPIPSEAAPIPNAVDSETYSIYNDTNSFTTTFPVVYAFGGTAGEPDLDPGAAENKALKLNFGVQGFGQGEGGPDDVSSYDFVNFYYWAGPTVTGFDFVMIGNSGAVTEHVYQVGVNEPIVTESWVFVEIPMSYFTGIGFPDTALFQWKVSPLNNSVDNSGIVYFDNIILTQNALSVNDFVNVDANVYPNPTKDVWNVNLDNQIIETVQVFDILGKQVIKLTPNSSEVIIEAAGLKDGIYMTKITTANGSKTVKLVKN